MSTLEIDDIHVEYHRRGSPPVRAVAGASVSVAPGQIVGLVGESGCGKSTLARAAVGLVPTTAGAIRFDGREISPLTRRARPAWQARLQMVFQNPFSSLNPRRRVGSQIADGLAIAGNSSKERDEKVRQVLDQVGLPPIVGLRYPHEFSGGQRQRIAIARALAASPSVIVLDEPLSSLDTSAQAQIANLLVELAKQAGIGLLLISHDLAIVRSIADAVSVMYLGVVVENGPTNEIWTRPAHPYSDALIASVPHADGKGTLPRVLAGEVPDPARPPTGCRFHPRCTSAQDRCKVDEPILEAAGGRAVACWYPRFEAGAAANLVSAPVGAPDGAEPPGA